jgi:hypothetical protein
MARPLTGVGSGGSGLRGYRMANTDWTIFRARIDIIPSSDKRVKKIQFLLSLPPAIRHT